MEKTIKENTTALILASLVLGVFFSLSMIDVINQYINKKQGLVFFLLTFLIFAKVKAKYYFLLSLFFILAFYLPLELAHIEKPIEYFNIFIFYLLLVGILKGIKENAK